MASKVSSLRKCYWTGNFVTLSLMPMSVNYFSSLYPVLPNSLVDRFAFVSLSCGVLFGVHIARYGRRKTLLCTDLIYLGLLGVLALWHSPYIASVWTFFHEFLRGICFITIFLFVKDFPPKPSRGFCGAVYCVLYWLGSCLDASLQYLTQQLTQPNFPPWYYLYLKLGVGAGPLLLQFFLFLLVYRDEPPGYYFLSDDEAAAIIATAKYFTNPAERLLELECYREETAFKKFRVVRWCDMCEQPYSREMGLATILHVCRVFAGMYVAELFLHLLADQGQRLQASFLLSIIRCLSLFLAIFFIDAKPVKVLLRLGFVGTLLCSCLILILLLLNIFSDLHLPDIWVIMGSSLITVPHYLLILPVSYKFVFILLPDKGIAAISIIIYISLNLFLLPASPITDLYGKDGFKMLLLVYVGLGIVASFIALVACGYIPERLERMEADIKVFFVGKRANSSAANSLVEGEHLDQTVTIVLYSLLQST